MKNFSIALISFILGAAITGAIAYKFFMEFSYHTVLGHLSDNLSYYEQLEQNKPERVKHIISTSLTWYILMVEDGNQSFWIAPTESASQILLDAKKLQNRLAGASQKQIKN